MHCTVPASHTCQLTREGVSAMTLERAELRVRLESAVRGFSTYALSGLTFEMGKRPACHGCKGQQKTNGKGETTGWRLRGVFDFEALIQRTTSECEG